MSDDKLAWCPHCQLPDGFGHAEWCRQQYRQPSTECPHVGCGENNPQLMRDCVRYKCPMRDEQKPAFTSERDKAAEAYADDIRAMDVPSDEFDNCRADFRAGADWGHARASEEIERLQMQSNEQSLEGEYFERQLTAANARIEKLRAALEFYANRENWERIEGHTKWASNLRVQDCAMLNCGGGRARLALAADRGDKHD